MRLPLPGVSPGFSGSLTVDSPDGHRTRWTSGVDTRPWWTAAWPVGRSRADTRGGHLSGRGLVGRMVGTRPDARTDTPGWTPLDGGRPRPGVAGACGWT